MSKYIYLIIPIAVVLIIILIVYFIKKSKKDNEIPTSILDVNDVGVSIDSSDFSYGYEKEETIVMKPVNEEENKEETTKVDNESEE